MWNFFWQNAIVNPLTNLLLLLYDLLGNNFLLALIVFTALSRLVMLPLSFRQQKAMLRTQELQPQIQAIQKKYRDNPQKMQEELTKIGYNPAESLMGCLPLFLQMPIFFGLYSAIRYLLSSTPQGLYQLSERAYDFINLAELLPVENKFGWLNLAQPDPLFILPVLVAGSMYLQQKLMTPPTPAKKGAEEDPAAQMQKSMLTTMPLMFGFFALQFASGLSIYFIVSNLIGIAQSWLMQRNKEKLTSISNTSSADGKPSRPVIIEATVQEKVAPTPKPKKEKSSKPERDLPDPWVVRGSKKDSDETTTP